MNETLTTTAICPGCGGDPDHEPESAACSAERARQVREAYAVMTERMDNPDSYHIPGGSVE